jgi:hypothetical protein
MQITRIGPVLILEITHTYMEISCSFELVGYSVGCDNIKEIKKDSEINLSPCYYFGSGDRI